MADLMDALGSTRGRILALIKQHERCHPDMIATELGLASSSVRQHLSALQRDGYVEPEEVREGAGRPRREYHVSRSGDELFPKRYSSLALALLHSAERSSSSIVGAFVEDEVARQKGRVNGFDTRTRLEEVAESMRSDGGLATVVEDGDAISIREPNCVYSRIAAADSTICEAHVSIIERLAAVPLAFTRATHPHIGGCRWAVNRPAAPNERSDTTE